MVHGVCTHRLTKAPTARSGSICPISTAIGDNDLYNRCWDLWCACDEIGLGIMLNEHHQTATCMVPAAPIMLGMLTQTQKSRLLILGNIPNATSLSAWRVALVGGLKGALNAGFAAPARDATANICPTRFRAGCGAHG